MEKIDKIVKSAITSALSLSVAGALVATTPAIAAEETEKCYGIVKAGMNDCQTTW